MYTYNLTHLQELESESIFVMRELAAQFENPALLFSGGKDSIVMVHLARKAFFAGKESLSHCFILTRGIISRKHLNTGMLW